MKYFRLFPHALSLMAIVTLSLSGCGSKGNATTTTSSTSTTSTTQPATSSPPTTGASGTTTAVSVAPTSSTSHLTDIRVAHQPAGDRVTFEFDTPAAPGYSVAYITPPLKEDPSDKEVAIGGSEILKAVFVSAAAFDINTGKPTYVPTRVPASATTAVVEVVKAGDFEGHLSWAIGTQQKAAFHVSTLTNPARVVIDFTP